MGGKGWNWGVGDFLLMGILLTTTGLAIDYAIKKIKKPKHRVMAVILILLALILTWAELSVNWISKLLNLFS